MYLKFKRLFDFFISFAILLLLFPLFIIVAVLIKLDSKGPICKVELVKMGVFLGFINCVR